MSLMPLFTACLPRPAETTNENYAAALHNALGNEIATPEAAQVFFGGTYPTPAMRAACRMIFDRLRNGGGNRPSVYRFNSRFGGGKTHTLIALAAMALHPEMVQSGAVEGLLSPELAAAGVQLVCFTGEDADVVYGMPLGAEGYRAKSLTGFVAYQLGGPGALERLREHDNLLTDPGAAAFQELMGGRPTLILVDELVQWIEKSLQNPDLNHDGIKTTISALAAAVDKTPKAVLVITSPEPGNIAFRRSTQMLTQIMAEVDTIISRTGYDMVPSEDTDLAAILRQRLFEQWDEAARAETSRAYADLWRRRRPLDAGKEQDFYDCYPFHPSVIEIIEQRLSNNTDFQRVRGTLRLLAATLQHNRDTEAALLHPWHITPENGHIRDELISRLHHEALDSAINADITAPDSVARRLANPLADKAAKVILLGSLAPAANSGLSVNEIVAAILSPQDSDEDVIAKAVEDLRSNGLYIDDHPGRDAVRFTIAPNIRREVQSRRARFSAPEVVFEEIQATVQQAFGSSGQRNSRNLMPLTVYPSRTNNAPDDPDRVHLAVVNPEHFHSHSPTLQGDLMALYEHGPGNGGQATRSHRNNVLFLVAEGNDLGGLPDALIRKMAAEDVLKAPSGELQDYQKDILNQMIAESGKHALQAAQRTWTHLFFPSNEEQWGFVGSHLRHDRLPAASDAEGDGQAAIIAMLYAHHKMPRPDALRFNPTEWRQTALRNGGAVSVGDLHREFTSHPGKLMILNRETFDRILDAAVKAGDLAIQTPTGEVIGEQQSGLHYGNDFSVWLPEHAPRPEPPQPLEPPATVEEVVPPYTPATRPSFQVHGVSAKVAVGDLTKHLESQQLEWRQVAQVTLRSARPEFLNYLASVAQNRPVVARFNYQCFSDDSNVQLTLRNRSAAQWQEEQRTVERVNRMAGVDSGDASVALDGDASNPQELRAVLEALDNTHDVQLTADFIPPEPGAAQ